MILSRLGLHVCAVLLAAMPATAAHAADLRFTTDPFAGTSVLQTPGRQVVAGELFVAAFDLEADLVRVDPEVFGIDREIRAFSGQASDLPDERFNVISLHDLDFDGVAGNGRNLNAIGAADLIAARLTRPGPGFFIYFNTTLNLNRLVYSTDLSSSTADLRIMARFLDQPGQVGIEALEDWGDDRFSTAVPEPATWAMMICGFGLLGAAARRRRVALACA